MARVKVPGIYMIRNKIDGKVYIGQSKDIPNRFKRYKWAVNTTSTYNDAVRLITRTMREIGIENFEFIILDTGIEYKNAEHRQMMECKYINQYHADDPAYGYNESPGGEIGTEIPRTQSIVEKLKRASPVYLYDTQTQNIQLYYSGAKGVGDEFGFGKDVMSHTVVRGSLFLDRYYVIPARTEERHALLEKLRIKKTENTDQPLRAQSHSANAFNKYKAAVDYIDKEAIDFFGM